MLFGRSGIQSRIVQDLDRSPDRSAKLIIVSGGSGSGKSSLIRSGVVPALRRLGWSMVASDEQYWTASGPTDGACYQSLADIPPLVIQAAADQDQQQNSVEFVDVGVRQRESVTPESTLGGDNRQKTVRFALDSGAAEPPATLDLTVAYTIPSTGIAGGTPPKSCSLRIGSCA